MPTNHATQPAARRSLLGRSEALRRGATPSREEVAAELGWATCVLSCMDVVLATGHPSLPTVE